MRNSEINRKTAETAINLTFELDGTGIGKINTGCGFIDHMLALFAKHGRFDLSVSCKGDTEVDYHHTVEDVAICLGEAFNEAIGNKAGIVRFADAVIPMDEALALCAIDISGRSYLGFDVTFPSEQIGTFDVELVREFFLAFVRSANVTLHFKSYSGFNSHHIAEACFKAFGRTLAAASKIEPSLMGEIPSTKGVL